MINSLKFEPMSDKYGQEVSHWFHVDAFSGEYAGFYNNTRQRTKGRGERHEWVIFDDDKLIGFFSLIVEQPNKGDILFAVNPDSRRQGFAKQILDQAQDLPEVKKLKHIVTSVEAENTAAQKVVKDAGFFEAGHDQNGMAVFEKIL